MIKVKKDWWLANSGILFLSGLFSIYKGININNVIGGAIIGGISIAMGIALLQRSKIIFWLVFATAGYGLLKWLMVVSKNTSLLFTFSSLVVIVQFALAFMLWQQIKTQKK